MFRVKLVTLRYSDDRSGLLIKALHRIQAKSSSRQRSRAVLGDELPSDEAFKFRRGKTLWHMRAAIGHAAARAVAQRVHVAEHTLRRPCASPPLAPHAG